VGEQSAYLFELKCTFAILSSLFAISCRAVRNGSLSSAASFHHLSQLFNDEAGLALILSAHGIVWQPKMDWKSKCRSLAPAAWERS
jgi:hypothetical protein